MSDEQAATTGEHYLYLGGGTAPSRPSRSDDRVTDTQPDLTQRLTVRVSPALEDAFEDAVAASTYTTESQAIRVLMAQLVAAELEDLDPAALHPLADHVDRGERR